MTKENSFILEPFLSFLVAGKDVSMAYGGILNNFDQHLLPNDTKLQQAVQVIRSRCSTWCPYLTTAAPNGLITLVNSQISHGS